MNCFICDKELIADDSYIEDDNSYYCDTIIEERQDLNEDHCYHYYLAIKDEKIILETLYLVPHFSICCNDGEEYIIRYYNNEIGRIPFLLRMENPEEFFKQIYRYKKLMVFS